jgi:uncharacterized protein
MEGKYFLYAGALLVLILAIGFGVSGIINMVDSPAGNVAVSADNTGIPAGNTDTGDMQMVNLKVSGAHYVMEPSVLKKGIPARLVADLSTMPGCSKAIIIPEFKVNKVVRPGDNIIEFTPDKAGTFDIACTMYMYTGKFSVTDDG